MGGGGDELNSCHTDMYINKGTMFLEIYLWP